MSTQRWKVAWLSVSGLIALTPIAALADQAPDQPASVSQVVVTAQRLAAARDTIQPQVGASTYSLNAATIETLPAGENTPLNQVLLQAPGVAQDSFSQLHIRGEHNGLQYRLNGVILPEGLSVFSQALSPQIAGNVELITGALPAEYGLRTAGIIDITTKSGAFANAGSASIYGGSHGDIEPSAEYGGSSGALNYFVSGSYLQNDLGIESPDGSSNPIHDHTRHYQAFAYLEDILDSSSSVSVIAGLTHQTFQIPDVFGEMNGGLGLNVNGQTDYPSQDLNENQTEASYYGVVSYLHTTDRFTMQVSAFARYSTLNFTPDQVGDILYDGVSQVADKTDTAGGLQAEGVYDLGPQHTLRAGVIVEVDHAVSDTTSQVLLIDNNPGDANYGGQVSDQPFTIIDNNGKTAETYSVYLQDEWKLLDNLTLNYGVRFDQFDGFVDQNQTSPRINLVWLPEPSTTIHIGYAKYFTPPPFELVGQETVQKFIEPIPGNPNITTSGSPVVADCGALIATTACPLVSQDTTPTAERANYFDVGAAKKLSPSLTVTIDSYLKLSNHLIDEGQFGAPIILTPFNYAKGRQYGVELTGSYAKGPFSAYANFAYSVAQGEGWQSSQFDFPQAQIDYVANHYIYLDHDERVAMSAGGSYLWEGTRFSTDLIFGTGLRQDGNVTTPSGTITEPDGSVLDAIPNGLPVGKYVQVNFGVTHHFDLPTVGAMDVRFDITNAFDEVYQIRTGTGVGVFAPQYGPRRGFFAGVTKDF
ncbi:MAG TPA: TonB-dependent receptor [Caulobacteraceae bacterium]|nr:TonB-dependent receptor [Caulobacteraceae bacterium]